MQLVLPSSLVVESDGGFVFGLPWRLVQYCAYSSCLKLYLYTRLPSHRHGPASYPGNKLTLCQPLVSWKRVKIIRQLTGRAVSGFLVTM
jgi:hypothetical protein